MTFRFVDLFAGLGGFHVALARLGGEAVFAAEWVGSLQDLYERNFGLRPHGDITKVDPKDIPDHDVLTAGFPCQPFSKAGEQLGFRHTEQGQLFFHVRDILREKRANYFILENVPNILRHKNGATIETIKTSLAELGYDVRIERFSPHEFGIPQIRDRVYIVGSKFGLDDFQWPKPAGEPTDIRSVLDSQAEVIRELAPDTLRCLNAWDRFLAACPADLELPSFPIWAMEFGATYPYETTTPHALQKADGAAGLEGYAGSFGRSLRQMSTDEQFAALPSHARREEDEFPKWKVAFIKQNREFYASNKSWIDPVLPEIQSFPSSKQKFEWNAKGEAKSIWNFVIQMRASGVRVKRSRTAPSLIAMTDTQVPIIGWERRYMTPSECAKLQSLESIQLPESRTAAYRALGNAVNAKVAQKIAQSLIVSSVPVIPIAGPLLASARVEDGLAEDELVA